jgi:segregation and condensation protein B
MDIDQRQLRQRVEGVLLLARTPLSSRRLAQLAGLEDGTQARTVVRELNRHYDQVGRSFQVKAVAGGFQLRTRPQFARWLRQLEGLPPPQRFSGPALETLTIVAYRQPVTRAEIEAIRGVSSGEMLHQLLDRGLVRIAGRSEHLGHPFLYATTRQFLTNYGLNGLENLPRAGKLRQSGLPAWASPVQNPADSPPPVAAPGIDPLQEEAS